MANTLGILRGTIALGLIVLASGCVVAEPERHHAYAEGYYDRDHHRYWHENGWHECGEHNEYCR
jgi:hypothetical protein